MTNDCFKILSLGRKEFNQRPSSDSSAYQGHRVKPQYKFSKDMLCPEQRTFFVFYTEQWVCKAPETFYALPHVPCDSTRKLKPESGKTLGSSTSRLIGLRSFIDFLPWPTTYRPESYRYIWVTLSQGLTTKQVFLVGNSEVRIIIRWFVAS